MLNSTKVIRYIESHLGYKLTDLELRHDEILEYIRMFSLQTYSKYFPYITSVNIRTQERLETGYNRIHLNLNGLEILTVNRIVTANIDYVDPSIITTTTYMTDTYTQINQSDTASMMRNPITWRFYPPDVLEVYPATLALDTAQIFVNCIHPEHFGTIEASMEEQFLKLALLDAKTCLYQLRHRFANLETPYGNIELFIDDLQDAESKKEELIEYWRKMAPRQSNRKRLYIY